MKEAELILGASDTISKGSFLVALTDHEVTKGEIIKNKDLNIIYVSVDGSMADRLMTLGIARKYNKEGKSIMLILNSNEEAQF